MNETLFRWFNAVIAMAFTAAFLFLVVPALLVDFDVLGAFAAGFVNPYASGYSTDVFMCWFALAGWVWFESATAGVRHGWVCLVLGVVPGVAVGFALYLILRNRQLEPAKLRVT